MFLWNSCVTSTSLGDCFSMRCPSTGAQTHKQYKTQVSTPPSLPPAFPQMAAPRATGRCGHCIKGQAGARHAPGAPGLQLHARCPDICPITQVAEAPDAMLRSAEPEGLEGVLLGDLRPCPSWESHCGGKGISLPQSRQGASGHLCWQSQHPISTAAQLAQPPHSPGAPHRPTRPLAPTAHLFC